ncbi:NAD(P)H-binding protein [Nocardia brasiliensis]|uniref:NAD(P)H-binding protein n=1 Tax=Nocardia brasiliensis TaxID=37326 RepID=UPI0036716CB1
MSETILVTGATSKNGAAALRHLGGSGHALRAATREPEQINQPNVRAVRFDWQDPTTYDDAVAGVTAAYVVIPEEMFDGPDRAREFVERAAAAGVRRIVALSARGVDAFPGHPLQGVETVVQASDLEWVILRPNWFMQNFTEGIFRPNLFEAGEIRCPGGDAKISFVDVDDIGAVAAAALTGRVDAGTAVDLTGPEALTFGAVAALFTEAFGREIRYVPLTFDDPELGAKMGLGPLPPQAVQALFGRVVGGHEASISEDIPRILGRPAGSFARFAAQVAQQPTAGVS